MLQSALHFAVGFFGLPLEGKYQQSITIEADGVSIPGFCPHLSHVLVFADFPLFIVPSSTILSLLIRCTLDHSIHLHTPFILTPQMEMSQCARGSESRPRHTIRKGMERNLPCRCAEAS
jgi:hypothetical protein